ncbi:MAG: Eco29kI family restriction endonuclease [Magnetococcales bacterium]|nr:Eco29kI family restriction endonuclease [Magnetococcales bacterium]
METPYNPLDKINLGANVAEALLSREAIPLADLTEFSGAGIYVLYYMGSFPAYALLAEENRKSRCAWPIYIGKAIPSGSRKGGVLTPEPSNALLARLREHAKSIETADNLFLADFHCRHLVVDDIWIPLGEALLIAWFSPVWNALVDGFGNHDPGRGRHQGMRPRWDVLHPGRAWAEKCRDRPESAEQIMIDVESYLRAHPIPSLFGRGRRTEG